MIKLAPPNLKRLMKPFVRNNYFTGRVLTAEDLRREQDYHREKQKLHNRELHGFGVVSGLELSKGQGGIKIEAGLALDCAGNEIVVSQSVSLDLPGEDDTRKTIFVGIRYAERAVEPTPSMGANHIEQGGIEETFAVEILSDNSNRNHRQRKGRWQACGASHPLTIARLRKITRGWRVDRHYRPPVLS